MQTKLYFNTANTKAKTKNKLFKAIQEESKHIGYYNLPNQDTSEIVDYSNDFDENIEHIVVLGIGGSSLGAKAIDEFLKPVKKPKRKLHFFESTDPINIAENLSSIDMDKAHFLIISKSGGTVETISIFKYIFAPRPHKENYTFITDKDSNLDKFAKDLGSKVFYLPENVGGRFSVLSIVGLLPLALVGVDITALLKGAKDVQESFFGNGHLHTSLIEKAIFYAKHHTNYNINCLFAYSDTLKYFSEWYVQLWGESLGKKQRHSTFHVGMTPIGLIGPKDQHSFLQLIMEGTRDKSVTFIKIKDFKYEMYIPPVTLAYLESLDILNGVPFHELIHLQCNSVMESLQNKGDIPLDEIIIDQVNEQSIGSLIYYYELLTSLVGELIDVNTYNQPGVEEGKIILKKKLTE
ncbi:MAG: Glucose-6-phosphate isomerase (EC [uncultured Sulfurovum sp.]|uniref:Glucose-6-phosphate isomerase n=1 Tax=uncultured Sulfurovum sp. TaxID=269237 RepID=A0A6S6TJ89_9BACT|nr:MAG: Glucose-6-phosphate isomerase (EC [uncultured Sulfurovum sp.]